jgi:hypothetical protein
MSENKNKKRANLLQMEPLKEGKCWKVLPSFTISDRLANHFVVVDILFDHEFCQFDRHYVLELSFQWKWELYI